MSLVIICHRWHQGSKPAIDFVGVPGYGPVDLCTDLYALFDWSCGR